MLIKSDSTNDNNDDELRRIQNSNKRITEWMKKGLKSEEKKARLKQIDEPVEAGRTRVKNKRSSFEIAWWASEQTTQHKRKTVGEEEGEKTKILNWKSCLNNLKCFWLQHRQKIEELKVWEASGGTSFRCCWCSPYSNRRACCCLTSERGENFSVLILIIEIETLPSCWLAAQRKH